jgi:hypothetical protein
MSDKIQHPFMVKALKKLGIDKMCLDLIKAIYNETTQHHTKWNKTETISSDVRNKTKIFSPH